MGWGGGKGKNWSSGSNYAGGKGHDGGRAGYSGGSSSGSGSFIPAWVSAKLQESEKIQERFLAKEKEAEEETKNRSLVKLLKGHTKRAIAKIFGVKAQDKRKKKKSKDKEKSSRSEPFKFLKLATKKLGKKDSDESTVSSSSSSSSSSSNAKFKHVSKALKKLMASQKPAESHDLCDLLAKALKKQGTTAGATVVQTSQGPKKLIMPQASPATEEEQAYSVLTSMASQLAPGQDITEWPRDKDKFLDQLAAVEGMTQSKLNDILRTNDLSATSGNSKKAKLLQLYNFLAS